jgi:site-specific DNA-methyltransferase (adenine-specific)
LDRIIGASSNEGDTVPDPFCGCGTAIAVAQRLNRRWVGIDITNLAINLIRHRLLHAHGPAVEQTYKVIGEPISVPDAEALAASDPYQFQWWALGLVGARPTEQKKGGDKGIDGRLYFHEGGNTDTKQIIFSVKAGHLMPAYVRDLRGVIEKEKATIGVLISMDEPTKGMRSEAASAGFYHSPWGEHPRLQLLTVAELLDGRKIDSPPLGQVNVTFKKAPKAATPEPEQLQLAADAAPSYGKANAKKTR